MKLGNKNKAGRIARYRVDLLAHLVGWSLFICFELTLLHLLGIHQSFWKSCSYYLLNIGLFYFSALLVFPRSMGKRISPVLLLPLFMVMVLAAYTLSALLVGCAIQYVNHTKNISPEWADIVKLIYRGTYFLMLAIAYWFPSRLIRQREKTAQLEKARLLELLEAQRLEKELVISRNAYLQARLNPHLLFNTLHFLQNEAYENSPEASACILLLSDILRYSMQEPGPEGKLPIAEEIEQVNKYIGLNQLRVNRKFTLDLYVSLEDADCRFIPLLLISLIENMFKHGNLANPEHPSFISITQVAGTLEFYSRNPVKPFHTAGGGIGLSNTRLRLESHYPNRYTFSAHELNQDYIVHLSVQL